MVQVASGLPGRRKGACYCGLWYERIPCVFNGAKGLGDFLVGPDSRTDFLDLCTSVRPGRAVGWRRVPRRRRVRRIAPSGEEPLGYW